MAHVLEKLGLLSRWASEYAVECPGGRQNTKIWGSGGGDMVHYSLLTIWYGRLVRMAVCGL